MKSKYYISFSVLAVFIACTFLIQSAEAKSKKRLSYSGDVEYNATEKSPTLPLVQTPPPQNYPSSVQVGVPSYYYYYYPTVGYPSTTYVTPTPGAGVSFYNSGGSTRRTFWYNTQIPGQVPPPSYGPSFYGSGYFPAYNSGGILYIP